MAKGFGNTGASSLVRTATSALNRANTYSDAIAAFNFDNSYQTQDDYNTYKAYLDKRVSQTQNVDPTKALSLTKAGMSAQKAFNSADVQRATQAINYGSGTLDDKYNLLGQQYQKAVANGDYNAAQNIESQMQSVDIQRQNAATAAGNAATASTSKAQSATKAGIDSALNSYDQAAKLAGDKVKSGQMTVQQYEAGMAKYYASKDQLLQEAASGQQGGLSQDAVNGYTSAHTTLSSSDPYLKSMAQYPQAQSGISSQYLHVDPALKNTDGTMAGSLQNRPSGSTVPVQQADGSIAYVHQYGGGWQGKVTQATRDKAVKDGQDYIFPQVGRDASGKQTTPANQVGGAPIPDQNGSLYVIDQNGAKHYITNDPNNPLQRSTEPIQSQADVAKQFQSGNNWSFNPVNNVKSMVSSAGGLLSNAPDPATRFAGGLLDRLVGNNNKAAQARQDAINLAAAQKQSQARQASDALLLSQQQAAQAKLLPVYRAPVPAPTPAPTTQYAMKPLPAPIPLGNTGISTPASTGNYKQDVLNLGRSLGGF